MLGYDIHGKPWKWADETRVMQALVLGTDRQRQDNASSEHHHPGPDAPRRASRRTQEIPMVIFDGKGDLEFFESLLPYIHRAGRMADLRLLNPSRPGAVGPVQPVLHPTTTTTWRQVSMVFGSFDLHDEFFAQAPTELPRRHRAHPALHRQAVQLLRRDGHGA